MKFKTIMITCILVVLYLSLCSWRMERLDEGKSETNNMILNVK